MTPDEYEELPCPDTNTYAVGDLVRSYDSDAMGEFTATDVNEDHLFFKDAHPFGQWIHWKACRPLKKKEPPKPREFWISQKTFLTGQQHEFTVYTQDMKFSGDIHVKSGCHKCGEDFNK